MSAEWLRGPAEDAGVCEPGRPAPVPPTPYRRTRDTYDDDRPDGGWVVVEQSDFEHGAEVTVDVPRGGALFTDAMKLRRFAAGLLDAAVRLERNER